MASDSRYIDAVGYIGMLDITDEGGWAFEALPQEDVVLAFGSGARAETEVDLSSPEERERAEFTWTDAGALDAIAAEEVAAASRAGAATAAAADDEKEEEEEEVGSLG
jgi:hypothetical protein